MTNHVFFPAIKRLAEFAVNMEDGSNQAGLRVNWSDHLDFLEEGDAYSAPAEALQEVLAILWENVRGADGSTSPANVDRIVRALVDNALAIVRHGVAEDTAAQTALWHNLVEMER